MALFSGCASLGPNTILRDRSQYDDKVAESWKQQMLLNIIKLRYADMPTFLDVSSIINQYGVQQQINANVDTSWPQLGSDQNHSAGFGGSTTYHDNPTITYTPLSGQKFTKNLLTPIPPMALLSMIQSGWPVDLIFSICVKSINGVRNYSPREKNTNYEEFMRLLTLWRELQDEHIVDFRSEKVSEKEENVFFILGEPLTEENKAKIIAVRDLMHAKAGDNKQRVVIGTIPQSDQEVAIMTRSILDIMLEMSYLIQVPEEHMKKQFTKNWDVADLGSAALVRIRSGSSKPQDAYASVYYHGYWFWIDQSDFTSKRNFTLLMIFMSLTETEQKTGAGPLVTI
jgi:hypothetical protein